MIKSLEINGFKSYISEIIDLGSLTVLTGLNSTGKSTIIQAIRILERVANNEKQPLLDGHGSDDELKNKYYDGNLNISAEILKDENHMVVSYNVVSTLKESVKLDFPEVIYISADRFGPRVSIPIDKSNRLGDRGENILNCIHHYEFEQLSEKLQHPNSEGDTFLFNLRAWLGAISPGVKFNYEISEITDSSHSTFNNYRSTNVGFGLSYTLPIIVALFIGTIEKNNIVLIENPEAHLHPRGQVELAKLIALAVECGSQVVVETHSDHLFDGIRVFAKNNKNFALKTKVYWFELDEDGNTIIENPKLDNNGRLNDWPIGMFDQFEINASELL